MKRQVVETIIGAPAVDGAGVHMVRVLGANEVQRFDPFLILDAFNSPTPDAYIKGFPFQPHRGIETVIYLMSGQETTPLSEQLLGLQLWINLPPNEKMTEPSYLHLTSGMIKKAYKPFGAVGVISGEYQGIRGVQPPYVQATVIDVEVKPDKSFSLPTDKESNLFVYVVSGNGYFGEDTHHLTGNKLAVRFDMNEEFYVKAGKSGIHFVLFAARPLSKPIKKGYLSQAANLINLKSNTMKNTLQI